MQLGGTREFVATNDNDAKAEKVVEACHGGALLGEGDYGSIRTVGLCGHGYDTRKKGGFRPLRLVMEKRTKAGGANLSHEAERIGGIHVDARTLAGKERACGDCKVRHMVELVRIAARQVWKLELLVTAAQDAHGDGGARTRARTRRRVGGGGGAVAWGGRTLGEGGGGAAARFLVAARWGPARGCNFLASGGEPLARRRAGGHRVATAASPSPRRALPRPPLRPHRALCGELFCALRGLPLGAAGAVRGACAAVAPAA
ncbi:hypothetical protein FGB62_2g364 [Gracilaria domingensis]|nr:hypothetical protein FGB62_2g364 [Gracilaria domingensis]